MANVVYGKTYATQIYDDCQQLIENLKAKNVTPKLAIILVGDDKASLTYIKRKQIACKKMQMLSTLEQLPKSSSTEQVVELIEKFNADPAIHGIIVQQPLPAQVNKLQVVQTIDPTKDVDGLHPLNYGLVANGVKNNLVTCTPKGCMFLLKQLGIEIKGKTAVVVGRSMIVGRPLALLLEQAGATVTICHSATKNLGAITSTADILAVAVGKSGLITKEMVKQQATVLDIGISTNEQGKMTGDVNFDEVSTVAKNITPVPGGIGPLTVAMLISNTVHAAHQQQA